VRGDQSDFAFSGLQPADESTLIQPVVGWGYLDVGNGSSTTTIAPGSDDFMWMAAYHYTSNGNSIAARVRRINPGDTIWNWMEAYNCDRSGGHCHWLIDMADENTGAISSFTVVSAPAYTELDGGEFESYRATSCNMLFGNHHLVWRKLVVSDVNYRPIALISSLPRASMTVRAAHPCGMQTITTKASNGGDIIWHGG
jgi:hypothetical protein